MLNLVLRMAEEGLFPDILIRAGIRRMLLRRIRQQSGVPVQRQLEQFARECRNSPIAFHSDAANAQHYELPASFFEAVLGQRLKYSCCLYTTDRSTLDEAEEAMLALTCERAMLRDGMDVLELGCGWGSLTLWMAEKYPASRITAVSNSHSQRAFIEKRAEQRGLKNIRVMTADMNDFTTSDSYDRVVSVEMFEHMRNYETLLSRVASWLKPDGRLFVHIFCHKSMAYAYEREGAGNWMGRYFFTGGTMPAYDLFSHFDRDVLIEERWKVNGTHYYRTCMDWLRRLDARKAEIMPVLNATYGSADAHRWFHRWRMFMLACAELFAYRNGEEWFVAHYRFRKS